MVKEKHEPISIADRSLLILVLFHRINDLLRFIIEFLEFLDLVCGFRVVLRFILNLVPNMLQELALKLLFLLLQVFSLLLLEFWHQILLLLQPRLEISRLDLRINELLLKLPKLQFRSPDLIILLGQKIYLVLSKLTNTELQLHDLVPQVIYLGPTLHFMYLHLHLFQLQVVFQLKYFQVRFLQHLLLLNLLVWVGANVRHEKVVTSCVLQHAQPNILLAFIERLIHLLYWRLLL